MAATKTCPSCETEVPVSAARCKDCFHDFSQKPAKNPLAGPLILLVALAFMAVVGATTLFIILQRPIEKRILVDEGSRSIVWITTYRSGDPVTERVSWDQVVSLEHLTTRGGDHAIVAVGLDGSRWTIQESAKAPLLSDAEHYKELMNKPLVRVDKTGGFGK